MYSERSVAGANDATPGPEMPSPTSVKRAKTAPHCYNRSMLSHLADPVDVSSIHREKVATQGSQDSRMSTCRTSQQAHDQTAFGTSFAEIPSERVCKGNKSGVLSIASLISPRPRACEASTAPSGAADLKERKLDRNEEQSPRSFGILSSISGIAQMSGKLKSCSKKASVGNRRNFVLPPIHSLRGFDITRTPRVHHVP